jgi:hypothetical protein
LTLPKDEVSADLMKQEKATEKLAGKIVKTIATEGNA